ncbi:MAG: Crp/Fnr family transcriptional regulator [Pseudomonadota bacterium]
MSAHARPAILPTPDQGEDGPRRTDDLSEVQTGLRRFTPFAELPHKVIDAVGANADFRTYSAGQTLLSSADRAGLDVFIIAKGALTITRTNAATGEIIVETIKSGEAFGLALALAPATGGEPNPMTVTASDEVAVWVIEADALTKLIQARPSLTKALLPFLAGEVVRARYGVGIAARSPQARICEHLLSLVERNDLNGIWSIAVLPRHREIADAVGVEENEVAETVACLIRNETVTRHYPGLIIDNMQALEQWADQ